MQKRASLANRYDPLASTGPRPDALGITRAAPRAPQPGKYTIILTGPQRAALLADESELTANLGRQPTKAAIFGALLTLMHEHEVVRTGVLDQLRDAPSTRNNGKTL